MDIEKCSARKIRLRGIVSHCPHPRARTSVSLHVKLSTPRVAKGRLTQTRETVVVILYPNVRSARRACQRNEAIPGN